MSPLPRPSSIEARVLSGEDGYYVAGMYELSAPYQVSIFCWFAFEIGLLVRDLVRGKGRSGRDRGTRWIVVLSLGAAIVLAWLVPGRVPEAATPAPVGFAVAGLVVMWTGLAVRAWAVLTLGGSFSTYLQVAADQAVVTRGPYRWVRHPSYTGLLLIGLGFGIGASNWLSLVICAVMPPLGLLPRIAVEESELVGVLGDRYRSYQSQTYRLVPGLW
ncbi:methyltransferase family protein [Catellatospora vulcania]|uniref:methyltransferase family protein n=1 Tax=Catellatospora vulcania TaxID=1460450 RepID=UPI0018AFDCB3|nr:isoprenylcysteine carboxylmethyltransferase family protein [Catellatospora vulcania]